MKIDCQLSHELAGDSEFVFLVQATLNIDQTLVEEDLRLDPPVAYRSCVHEASGNRFLRVRAQAGPLRLHFRASVDRRVDVPDLNATEVPVHAIPDELMRFLLPTRYRESDLLGPVAQQIFAASPIAHARVQAICAWALAVFECLQALRQALWDTYGSQVQQAWREQLVPNGQPPQFDPDEPF